MSGKMDHNRDQMGNRPAAVAGRFYPGTEKKLREEVESLFGEAKPPLRPEEVPRALIVPHAGYVFSGRVAASAFNQIPGGHRYHRIFILASSHQMSFPGASVWCAGDYETPLGRVPLDRETCRLLAQKSPLITTGREAHLGEHSLEVQLPFLQHKLGDTFLLVPLILGTHHPQECLQLADLLRPFFTPENLFVASSDLSHYPCYEDAVTTDKATTEAILTNAPEKLLQSLEENRKKKIPGLATSLCGWTSVVTLLHLTSAEELSAEWIDYRNSGDEPHFGDHDRVVGYSAVAFFHARKEEFFLTHQEKEKLLQIATHSVREIVVNKRRISPEEGLERRRSQAEGGMWDKSPHEGRTEGNGPVKDPRGDGAGSWTKSQEEDTEQPTNHPRDDSTPLTGHLALPAGAFVSIYIAGKLRGCIGSFDSGDPLAEVVCRSAASATHDGRFNPPEPDELPAMILEISVLTPLRRIYSPEEIVPGKHGIYIKKGWSSGTFLPQVATKYGWEREELLGRCSRDKAGLGWEGWRNAELYTYEAIVFRSTSGSTP